MRLIVASANRGKIAEIKSILSPFFSEIQSMTEAGISIEIEETGSTFLENALIKARAIWHISREYAVLADDSGLCVDCLAGEPGVRSARYAGDMHDDTANLELLIKNCRPYPAPRTARFVSAMALILPSGLEIDAEGSVEGEIILTPRGSGGFGYDPVFYYPPYGKTFAEASFEEKNAVSHRRMALEKIRACLAADNMR